MIQFSIITINLNNASGLQKTIASVLNQTCTDFEFIVIDGGSTDRSVDLITKYANKITNWVSENDSGIYHAMNKGIALATGQYCLFLNSGDWLLDQNVLALVSGLNAHEDILYGDVVYYNGISEARRKIYPKKLRTHFLITDVICHQAQFIKRELFEKYGDYLEKYEIAADYEFFVRLFFKEKISTLHIHFFAIGYDLSGLSSNPINTKQIWQERKIIQQEYFPKLFVMVYYAYANLLQSRIAQWPIFLIPIKLMRNLVFKFIKPQVKQ